MNDNKNKNRNSRSARVSDRVSSSISDILGKNRLMSNLTGIAKKRELRKGENTSPGYIKMMNDIKLLEKQNHIITSNMKELQGISELLAAKTGEEHLRRRDEMIHHAYYRSEGIREFGEMFISFIDKELDGLDSAREMKVSGFNTFVLPMLYKYRVLADRLSGDEIELEQRLNAQRLEVRAFMTDPRMDSIPSIDFEGIRPLLGECISKVNDLRYGGDSFDDYEIKTKMDRLRERVERNARILNSLKRRLLKRAEDYVPLNEELFEALKSLLDGERTACLENDGISAEEYREKLLDFSVEMREKLIEKYKL